MKENKKILLSSPHMSEEKYEQEYIKEAFQTNWISPLGKNVDEFEKETEEYLTKNSTNSNKENYAVALNSGTSAIHIALKLAKIKKGDTVFCQDLTFAATCNPIIYEGAQPVFIDSEYETWNMSPKALKKAFEIYPECKIVIVVHLYGNPAKMDEILEICKEHNAILIEDSCESLGSIYKNQETGIIGDFGTFSYNGNKIITTSGGGMLITHTKEDAEKVKFLITQAKENKAYYEHKEIGYNYRMSNILAGIGRGQLKVLDKRIKKKKEIYELYQKSFKEIPEIKFQKIQKETNPNHWLTAIYLNKTLKTTPEKIIKRLAENNIEVRHVWKPMHLQPIFKSYDFISQFEGIKSVSQELFEKGICLPSGTKMREEEQEEVIKCIKNILKEF